MTTAGYSGTPLIKKLGISPEMNILLLHAPANYFDLLEQNIADQLISGKQMPDLIHLFAKNIAVFEKEMQKILKFCKANTGCMVWISWYKKTAGIATDLNENLIRNFALQHNLVDVKVCAVNEQWSGLKLVVPLAKR